jgi:hypothetical protein
MRLALLALALALFAQPALADSTAINAAVFPLANANQLFPSRNNRLSLKCFNPTANGNVTIIYASGYTFVIAPGGSLWETNRPPSGKVSAIGTAGQILACEDFFQ